MLGTLVGTPIAHNPSWGAPSSLRRPIEVLDNPLWTTHRDCFPGRFRAWATVCSHWRRPRQPGGLSGGIVDRRPDAHMWINAMKAEIESIIANKMWTLYDLPPGRNCIGTKWVYLKYPSTLCTRRSRYEIYLYWNPRSSRWSSTTLAYL